MVRLKDSIWHFSCGIIVFQFHYGTIKRMPPWLVVHPRANFNSTMVRLKDCFKNRSGLRPFYFNSTMVRLKVPCRCWIMWLVVYFNSTMVRLKVCCSLLRSFALSYFNSTMVRLKVNGCKSGDTIYIRFQFHYGTIKRKEGASSSIGLQDFNSTMVRLKDLSRRTCFTAKVFQFHYGTIKRKPTWRSVCIYPISIPLWYD